METELDPLMNHAKLLTGSLETAEVKPMSKRQQKLMKQREEWLKQKEARRLQQKEKRKEKRRQKIASGVDLGPSRKLLKKNTMKESQCRVAVAIDLSFDELMADKDINKLAQQIQYCYSRNRRAANPLQLHLTSLGDKTEQRLGVVGDYKSWDIFISNESYSKLVDSSDVVYLTSDSPNVLETLDSGKVYVIGGLVDHNHHKGICYERAVKGNINHARLPIDEYCKLNSRRVLAINTVFEILLRFTETNSWHDSFYQVIPKRKIAATDGDSARHINSADTSNDSEVLTYATETIEAATENETRRAGFSAGTDGETLATSAYSKLSESCLVDGDVADDIAATYPSVQSSLDSRYWPVDGVIVEADEDLDEIKCSQVLQLNADG